MPYTKIGMHFMGGNDRGEGYSKLAAPTVIKLVNAFGDADKMVNLPHKPLVIGRISRKDAEPETEILRSTPQACADWYFGSFLQREIDNNPAIKWWETINEPVLYAEDNNHALAIERMKWIDEYQEICAKKLIAQGKGLVAFNFSVGVPFGRDIWIHAKRTLDLTRTGGVIIGLHRYLELIRLPDRGIDYQTTINGFWGTYHEADINHFSKMGYMPKIVITECGLENIGAGKPWKTEGITAEQYAALMYLWGKRFELYQQVIGATVFTVGGGGWESYDVANTPFQNELIKYAQSNTAPTPPPVKRRMTNQDVINLVARVGKARGRNLLAQMPHDLLQYMAQNRNEEYMGATPLAWGLTADEKNAVAREMF